MGTWTHPFGREDQDMAMCIEFTDHRYGRKASRKREKLYYLGEPDQTLIDELEFREHAKFWDGSGVEYESTLPEITSKGWDLVFVLPCGKYQKNRSSECVEFIENTYIFKKNQS